MVATTPVRVTPVVHDDSMYGTASRCLFAVFSNAGAAGEDALEKWYMEVHGPDAIENGSFSAVHRYRAVGDYEARFLALWEGSFQSTEEARDYIVPRAAGLRTEGRIHDDQQVVWSSMHFLESSQLPAEPFDVGTLTLVEGPHVAPPSTAVYRYTNLSVYETESAPPVGAAAWSGVGREGLAPHGPYRGVFSHPGEWPPPGVTLDEAWRSHWIPIGSLPPLR
jgi:hypothetical protein